jgi:hypothetical protein
MGVGGSSHAPVALHPGNHKHNRTNDNVKNSRGDHNDPQ